MTEELITRTGRIGGLRVISRTSVNRLKNSNRPLEDLARELEVEAVVEGSVSRNGPRVRITVKLIQVLPERPLWSDSYDGDLQDLPAIQREITEAIARHVGAEDRLPSRRQPPRPVHPDALDAYLQGRFHWNRRTAGDLHAALQHFRRATEIDPAYARAHAGLADTYNVLLSWTIEATRPAEGAPCAKASARAALALDPDLSEAHTALAGVLHLYEWDWRRAEAEYRRAIELNPGYASAHHWYSQLLQQRGRWAECLIEAQKAQQLDPLSPAIAASWGWRLHLAGRGDEAVAQLTRALRVSPDFVVAHWYLGQVHEHQRRFADARAALERAVALSSGAPIYLAALAHSRALAGDRAGAVDVLGSLGEMAASRYVSPYNFALIHAALGDDDRALGWLEQAHRERAAWMVYVRLDPRLARLHGHPAFERIARAVGV